MDNKNKRLGNFKGLLDQIVNTNIRGVNYIVVAGGFLRDIMLNHQPKDIDIFFSGGKSSKEIVDYLKKQVPMFEGCEVEFFSDKDYGGDDENPKGTFSVYDVSKLTLTNGIQVDVVAAASVWDDPYELLAKNFDCSINAIAYTKNGIITPNGNPCSGGIHYPLGGIYLGNPMTKERMEKLILKDVRGNWNAFKHLFKEDEWKYLMDIKTKELRQFKIENRKNMLEIF